MQCSWWHDGHGGKRARFHDEVPLSLSHPSSVHRARTNPHPQRTPLLVPLVLDGRRGLPPGCGVPPATVVAVHNGIDPGAPSRTCFVFRIA